MIRFRDEGALGALWQSFSGVMEKAQSGGQPVLLTESGGKARDFTFMPIRQYGAAVRNETLESFSQLLDRFYTRRAQAEHMRQKAAALTKTVKTAHDRVLRKLSAQREELAKTADRERVRRLGDLITANLYRIERARGPSRGGLLRGGRGEVEFPRPLKTPQQNAARYREYAKLKNAEIMLTEQITLGERSLNT